MSDIGALVEELIAAGTPPGLAASIVARAIVIGKDAAPYRDDLPDTRTKAAIRQQRHRDRKRNETVTQRNGSITECESVTRNVTRDDNVTNRNENVTERNENVTPLRPANNDISYLPSTSNLSVRKESKKERVQRKRNAPLPDDWLPSMRSYEVAEQHGVNVQIVEQIFRDYLKSSGKLYADYDAAFNNFLRNQRNFGNGKNGTVPTKSGSLVDSINRDLAALQQSDGSHFELPEGRILRLSK